MVRKRELRIGPDRARLLPVKTRAAIFRGVGEPLMVEEVDLDEPGPRDVLVQMAAVGICGTDLPQVKGNSSGRLRDEVESLTGTMYGSEDPAVALPILLEHVRAGRLDLASLVGTVYPLDSVDEAVAASLAGSPGRVLVTP